MDALPGRGRLSTQRHLPRLDVRDLTGASHVLPDDLPTDPCVVVLAFRQRQQRDVDAWVEALPDATVIEVPLLGTGWRMVRGWIEGGMAGGTPEDVQGRVWCAYGSLKHVLAEMGQEGHRSSVTAVVRRSGEVLVLFRGEPSPGAVMAVRTALVRHG